MAYILPPGGAQFQAPGLYSFQIESPGAVTRNTTTLVYIWDATRPTGDGGAATLKVMSYSQNLCLTYTLPPLYQ